MTTPPMPTDIDANRLRAHAVRHQEHIGLSPEDIAAWRFAFPPGLVIMILDELLRARMAASDGALERIAELEARLAAVTVARDEACDIAERRGAVIDYLRWKIDGYDTVFDVADEIEHGLVDQDGRARIEGATRLPNSADRISALRLLGTETKGEG